MADPPLADYWKSKYGIPDWPAFKESVAPAFSLAFPIDIGGNLADTAERVAAVNPASAFGVLSAAWLSKNPYEGSPSFGAVQAIAAAAADAVNSGLEASMPSLIIPNAFQVTIEGTASGQPVDNVIGVTNPAGTALGAATAVKTAWEATGGPLKLQTNLLTINNYHAVDLASAFGTIADVPSTATGGNTTTPTISTMAACALLQWNGSNRSRSTRGRLYLGPLTEGNVNSDGRTLQAAGVTAFTAAFTQLISQLNGAGYPLVVLSRKLLQAFPVTSVACETTIATQRRRIR